MKSNVFVYIFFFVLIGAMLALPAEKTNFISGSIRDVFAAPQTRLRGVRDWFRSVTRDKVELQSDIANLKIETEKLRNEIKQNKPLLQENQELRALLKIKSTSKYSLLPVQLLARDVSGWWQMARVDKGADDGIRMDLPVISPEGLIGQIAGVSAGTADVLFLTNPKVKIAARLAQTDIFGIVRGQGVSWQGDARCRMDFILKDAEISRAREVVTSGLGGVYPSGLVIGYVENYHLDPSGLFQYAEIIPAADFRSLDFVFVVLPEKKAAENGEAGMKREAQ